MAESASNEQRFTAGVPPVTAPVSPPGAVTRKLIMPTETEQERRERLYREHIRWALTAVSPPRRDGRIDGAQLLREVMAMNHLLYDANLAFD